MSNYARIAILVTGNNFRICRRTLGLGMTQYCRWVVHLFAELSQREPLLRFRKVVHPTDSVAHLRKFIEFLFIYRNRDRSDLYRGIITFRLKLTISTHPDGDALLQSTILAAVPVDPQNRALLILCARPVLDLLLDAASEEALRTTL